MFPQALRTSLPGLAAAVLTAALMSIGALDAVELGTLNRLFELRGPRKPAAPIVLITIDEDSFDELNLPWPFPRALHAKLIDTVAAGRPLVIGLDLLFSEPSPRGRADDEALGQAVARAGNVVLGAARTEVSEEFYRKVDLNMPLPVIRRGAAAVAPVNLYKDVDAHVRRAPLRLGFGDESLAGFDTELYRLAAAGGLVVAPLPKASEILVNFRGWPRTFPWVPYHRVVSGDVPPEFFRGRIVVVGPTSEVLHDVFPTPFSREGNMPGVEIHANVLDTLIVGNPLHAVPRWVSLVAAGLAALVGTWVTGRLRALRAFLAVAGLWVVLAGATFAAFTLANVWFQAVGVTLALVMGYGGTVVDNFVREQREKRRLSQFFSPAVLSEIVRHRGDAALGSSRRLVTVLFSDIRGFTSISERIEPEQVAEMLREYLTEMTEVVFRHGGTVDKYIGDCIMALYNVPFEDAEHAVQAVRTGLDFQERTLVVSARWEAKLGVQIRNGVGINTGEAVVGTMGSRQRREYTAIGDTVNLASRLESLTKERGVGIIISEFTYAHVKGQFLTRELGAVSVKGKTRPVKIYAVVPGDIRKHPRAAVDAAATIIAVGLGHTHVVRTVDMSEGGLALTGVPDDWAIGSRVEIRCEGGALPKPLAVEGSLAWRRDDRVGVSFTALDPDAAPAIAALVRRQRS